MALMLDGTAPMPSFGGSGAGLGVGGGVLGGLLAGGIGGALAGSLFNRNGNGFGGNGGGGDIAYDALQTQIQTLQGQVGANDLRNELESVENTFATISSGQTAANAANFNAVGAQIGMVQTAQAANNFTTLQSINDLGRDITASNTQALINSIQNFNQVQLSQQTATNQIISNLTAMSAANAECCCDIKQLIQSDGNLTRALINDNTIQALRDKNAELAVEVSNFKQNQFLVRNLRGSEIV